MLIVSYIALMIKRGHVTHIHSAAGIPPPAIILMRLVTLVMVVVVMMVIIIVVLIIVMVAFLVSTISKLDQQRFFPSLTRSSVQLLNNLLAFVPRFHPVKLSESC